MKVAVVVLNWNGIKLLKKFIPSVVEYSKEADIYIIDNNSSDNSIEFLRSKYSDINIIENSDNYGYAKGYNEGLKHIKADVYCLLNSDVEVSNNWIIPVKELFLQNENISVIQPKILDYKNKSYFEYAGAAGGYLDFLGYPYCRGRIFETLEEDLGQYNDETEIFWASGAAFFIRKKIFDELGGFDEDYFAHQEEIDLCWRIQNQGYKIYYTYKSEVYHLGGATLSNMNSKKTFLNFRNSLFNLIKNNDLKDSIFKIFFRLCLDGVAGVKFLLRGDYNHFLAILKAHLGFYVNSFKMYKKKTIIKSPNLKTLNKSIVFEYFIMKKKIFDEL